ncbi:recombinase family protein [Pontiellaceae bacterium B1224]|nr:recombinase family protein [Pontiellaceae bacterium B1224]
MKAIIYTRVSTSDQKPENQIRELKAYAEKQGWEVLEVIKDKMSGTKAAKDRPGLNKVMKLAAQQQFDVLLFWSLDRLSREGTRQTLGYLQTLSERGVKWHSYSEEYLSSLGAFADVVVSILSTLAKQERIRISERTKAGLQRAKAEGKTLGRPEGKQTQKTIDRIRLVKQLRAEGYSFTKIGQQLGITKQRAAQLHKMEAA